MDVHTHACTHTCIVTHVHMHTHICTHICNKHNHLFAASACQSPHPRGATQPNVPHSAQPGAGWGEDPSVFDHGVNGQGDVGTHRASWTLRVKGRRGFRRRRTLHLRPGPEAGTAREAFHLPSLGFLICPRGARGAPSQGRGEGRVQLPMQSALLGPGPGLCCGRDRVRHLPQSC